MKPSPINKSATLFATQFNTHFLNATRKIGYGEIPLFREFSKSLLATSNQFKIEEYHGCRNQVSFSGDKINARNNARCELSDLMLLVFSADHKNVRLTYIQAKSERSFVDIPCKKHFTANTEQWFLLSKRPQIQGLGNFNPPPDLLSNAILPSIGTFIFFHKLLNGDCQLFYAVADFLNVSKNLTNRIGKLNSNGYCNTRKIKNYIEITASCNNFEFAYHLYSNSVGSPIIYNKKKVVNNATINWLASGMSALVKQSNNENKILGNELLEVFRDNEISNSASSSLGARKIIILKTNEGEVLQ